MEKREGRRVRGGRGRKYRERWTETDDKEEERKTCSLTRAHNYYRHTHKHNRER